MPHAEREMADVVAVLDDRKDCTIEQMAEQLRQAGLEITDIDAENRIIEGACPVEKKAQITKLDFVKYLRDVFKWEAVTPGEPDADADGDDDEEIVGR